MIKVNYFIKNIYQIDKYYIVPNANVGMKINRYYLQILQIVHTEANSQVEDKSINPSNIVYFNEKY